MLASSLLKKLIPVRERSAPTAVHKGIEVDFQSVSPNELRQRILNDGCCVLRNALPVTEVIRYRDMLEEMYGTIADKVNAGEELSDWDRYHIRDDRFIAKYGEANSFFNLLQAPQFSAFMDGLFGKGHYQRALHDTVSRSIHCVNEQRNLTSFWALQTHLDGLYHETWPYFAINYWIPLSICGAGTNSPGFAVYPTHFEDVREYIGVNTREELEKKKATAPNGVIPMEVIHPLLDKLYRARNIKPITPRFEIGDVVIINSWTPHGTFWDGKMSQKRLNLELRFVGDSWNPLPLKAASAA